MNAFIEFLQGALVLAAADNPAPFTFAPLNDFFRGAIAMGHLIAGLFFLRFYYRVGDRLFLMFCGAFWLLGIIRLAMVFNDPREHNYLYWIRFVAYLLILLAIVDKNIPRESAESAPLKDDAA